MKRFAWVAAAMLGFTALPATASAQADTPAAEARIPFLNHGGIRDWRAVDSDTLYLQDSRRRWYRAELMYRAFDLPFAWAIGFDTRGPDTLDRFSSVVVKGQRVPLRSLVRVDGPPPAKGNAKRQDR